MDITKIPTEELFNDLDVCLRDALVCDLALLHSIETYSGGSVQGRLRVNQAIIAKIRGELGRRQVAGFEKFALPEPATVTLAVAPAETGAERE